MRGSFPFDFAQGQDDDVGVGVGVQDEDKEATTTADPYGMTTKKTTAEAIRTMCGQERALASRWGGMTV